MTPVNNHTRPAEGQPDIEVSCFYDTDRSQMDFRDNIEVIQYSDRKTGVGYYIDNRNLPGSDSVTFTVKGKRAALVKYITSEGHATPAECRKMKMTDLKEVAMDTYKYCYDKSTKQLLIDYATERMEQPEGLEIVPSKHLECVTVIGYSQGDYAEVLYCPSDCLKVWGAPAKPEIIKKMLHHFYWDAPINCTVTIDGTEYNYWDMPEYDEYEYDRDLFLDYVTKESGIDRQMLEPLLPHHPDYR